MELERLELDNFFSYERAALDLKDRGLVLVTGENKDSGAADSNGAGKSALLVDGPAWVLYGTTVREKIQGKTPGEFDVSAVVRRGGGVCRGSLTFSVGGELYRVVRERHPKHATLELYRHDPRQTTPEWVCLTGESLAETQGKIDRLAGLTYEAYCHSAVFAQGAARRFTQCTDSERRKILEEFFELGVFDGAQKLVAADLAGVRALDERLDGQILVATSACDELLARSKDLAAKKREYLAAVRDQARTDQERAVELVRQRKERTALRKAKETELRVARGLFEAELEQLLDDKEFDALRHQADELRKRLGGMETTERRLLQNIKELERRVERFHGGDECPECLRTMNASDVAAYKKLMQQRLAKLMRERSAEAAKLSAGKAQLDTLLETVRAQEEGRRALEDKEDAVGRLEKEIAAMDADDREDAKEQQLLGEKRTSRKAQEESYQRLLSENRAAYHAKEAELVRAESEKTDLAARRDDLEFWELGFRKRIKDFCFKRALGFLNERLAHYSRCLSGGEVSARLEYGADGKIKLRAEVRGSGLYYVAASGGQARRIDLALGLAMKSLVEASAHPVNVLVIDEFSDALDSTGRDMFLSFLQDQAASQRGSVFVITHSAEFTGQFSNVLNVTMEHGKSTVAAERAERVLKAAPPMKSPLAQAVESVREEQARINR